MQLYEEYLNRHKINKPLVSYKQTSTAIIVGGMPTRWVLLNVLWNDPGGGVGHYAVEYLRPIHDGHTRNRCFERFADKKLCWDEYEDYFIQVALSLKDEIAFDGQSIIVPKLVCGSKDVLLSLWEMFLFVYDGWICRQPGELKNYIYRSVNPESSAEERYAGYMESLVYLATRAPSVLKSWKTDFMPMAHNYATWLIDLYRYDESISTR